MSDTTPAIKKSYRLLIFDWEGTLVREGAQLFDGVQETLSILKKHYLLAVATNRYRQSVNRLLKETGLTDYFSATRCADETAQKSDPLMLQEILWELNITPDQAIMIGDSESDLIMAKRAGMDSIAVIHDENHLKSSACQPIMCVREVRELVRWLK